MTHLIHSGFTAWCGFTSHSNFNLTSDIAWSDCSKCSSRYYAAQTKDSPYRLGERVNMADHPARSVYRSIYPIIQKLDDAVIGFVTIKFGWGTSWSVHALTAGRSSVEDVQNDVVHEPIMDSNPIGFHRGPDVHSESNFSAYSKEGALFRVPNLVSEGKLPTREAVIALIRRSYEMQRRALAHEKTKRDQQMEIMALIEEEFTGMLIGTLTNRQRMAITSAMELLKSKGD